MKYFLTGFIVVIFGFSLSLVYGFMLFGKDPTMRGISVLSGRFLSVFDPSEVFVQKYIPKDKISNTGQESSSLVFYQNLNLDFDTEEMERPMIIPTNGIAGHKNFLYLPATHPGIDIWTNKDGSGLNGDKKGHPVYAACSGVVSHYKRPNEEIEITCDKLPDKYKAMVPSLKVKILYSHLGDGQTLESYHSLKVGQRVKMGEFVGWQGNKSSFVPENRVVHLHFGVYDLSSGKSPSPPLDPMYYIGVSTHKVGEIFTSQIQQNIYGENTYD